MIQEHSLGISWGAKAQGLAVARAQRIQNNARQIFESTMIPADGSLARVPNLCHRIVRLATF
jgi:hypothetical protein